MSILDNVKTQGPWRNAARKRWKQLCLAGWIASFIVAAHGQTSANTSAEQKPSAKVFYVAKPIHPAPYLVPMKPLVHLADLKQKHKGEVNWTELVVYDKNNRAEVTSAAPGSKLPRQLHSDAPEYWVVLEGRIRFEVEDPPGKFQTFEAGKGDLVLAPERHLFSLEVVGSEPAVRLAVTLPDTSTIYETRPQHAEKGTEYIPVTLFTGDNPDDVPNDGKPDRLFFNIDELQKEHPGIDPRADPRMDLGVILRFAKTVHMRISSAATLRMLSTSRAISDTITQISPRSGPSCVAGKVFRLKGSSPSWHQKAISFMPPQRDGILSRPPEMECPAASP